jgi:hypothetical protein
MAMSLLPSADDYGDLRNATPDVLTLEHLPDGELAELARSLRAEALRGDRRARGQAHMCEAELRRRQCVPEVRQSPETLDLRSLDQRRASRPWWKRW